MIYYDLYHPKVEVSDCRKTPAFSMVYGSRGFLVYAKIDMVMGMLDKAGNRRNQIQMVDVDMLVPEEHLLRKELSPYNGVKMVF
jgi:hypothetical protein